MGVKTTVHTQKAYDALIEKQITYQRVFSTSDGDVLLNDLAKMGSSGHRVKNVLAPTTDETFFNLGMKSVFDYVQSILTTEYILEEKTK